MIHIIKLLSWYVVVVGGPKCREVATACKLGIFNNELTKITRILGRTQTIKPMGKKPERRHEDITAGTRKESDQERSLNTVRVNAGAKTWVDELRSCRCEEREEEREVEREKMARKNTQ